MTVEAHVREEAPHGLRLRLASYAELAKIRISTMVALTTAAGFDLAPRPLEIGRCLATVFGTMLVASAAGALNQVVERDLDARMRRTERRPIPTKRVTEWEATVFALVAAIVGEAILLAFVNPLTAALSAGCLLFYVGVYTPLKTRTTWNTLVGAVAGAVPPVLGWTGATGSLGAPALVLFLLLAFWQLPHFFAIASIYRDDYLAAGYRMLPVVDERGTRTSIETLGFTVLLVAVSVAPYFMGIAGVVYLVGALACGLAFLGCTVAMVVARGARPQARRVLLASVIYLPCVLGLLVVGKTGG